MSKLNVTPGETFCTNQTEKSSATVYSKDGDPIANVVRLGEKTASDTATLFNDAHNTYNKFGKIPSELLGERETLIEALRWNKLTVESMDLHGAESTIIEMFEALLTRLQK